MLSSPCPPPPPPLAASAKTPRGDPANDSYAGQFTWHKIESDHQTKHDVRLSIPVSVTHACGSSKLTESSPESLPTPRASTNTGSTACATNAKARSPQQHGRQQQRFLRLLGRGDRRPLSRCLSAPYTESLREGQNRKGRTERRFGACSCINYRVRSKLQSQSTRIAAEHARESSQQAKSYTQVWNQSSSDSTTVTPPPFARRNEGEAFGDIRYRNPVLTD